MNLKKTSEKLMSTRSGATAVALVLLALLLILNLFVSLLPYSVTEGDLSGVGMYALSGASKTFLGKLDEDVTIYCLTQNGDESTQLSTLFSRYTKASKHIKIRYVDAANDEAFCKKYGLTASDFTSSSKNSSMVIESARRYTYLDYSTLLYYYSEASGRISLAEYSYMTSIYSAQGAAAFKTLYGFEFSSLRQYYDADSKITNAIEYVTREDLSYTLTLSEDTRKFLSGIEIPVTVSCIWSGDRSECKIAGILDQYAAANRNITVRYIDPSLAENAAFIEKHFTATPDSMTVVVESDRRSTVIKWSDVVRYHHAKLGTMTSSQYASILATENQLYSRFGGQIPYGYCYSYYLAYSGGSSSQSVSLFNVTSVTSYFDGEEAYTEAIDYVIQETIPHAYIVAGDLGTPLSAKLTGFFTDSATDYEVLENGIPKTIPDNAASLILYAPKRDLTDAEAQTLTNYLKNGGHLLLFTNAGSTSYEKLMGVLSSYGVTAGAEIVRDGKSGSYEKSEEHLLPTVNSSHSINYYPNLAGYRVDMPMTHLLRVAGKDDLPDKVTVTELLNTSKEGYISIEKTNEDGSTVTDRETASFPLAVEIKNSETGANIVWYASTEMLSDDLILTADEEKAANESKAEDAKLCGNKYYIALAVSYLGREFTPTHKKVDPVSADTIDGNRITVSATPISKDYLAVSNPAVILIGILTVLIFPAVIIAVGCVNRSRRRKA